MRIATAEVQDEGSSLKVTLVEPEDVADQTDQIADQTDSTTTDERQLTTASSRIELPVSLKTSLLSEDEGELVWTLQTDGTDQNSKQETTFTLPSLSTLIDELGLNATTDKNDDSENAEEGNEDTEGDVAEPAGEQLAKEEKPSAQNPGVKFETTDDASAKLTTVWADNNDSHNNRPDIEDVDTSKCLVQFRLDSGEWIDFTAENAEKYLGITAEEFAHYGSPQVAEEGGAYVTTLSGLPSTVIKRDWQAKTEDGGQLHEVVDGESLPVWECTPVRHAVTWRIYD